MTIKTSPFHQLVKLLLPTIFFLLLAACSPVENSANKLTQPTQSLPTAPVIPVEKDFNFALSLFNRTFYLTELQAEGETTKPIADHPITLIFDNSAATGNSGCNNYGAPYRYTYPNLVIENILGAKLVCKSEEAMQLESTYLQALKSATTLAVTGNTLTLAYPTGVLIFSTNPPAVSAENTPTLVAIAHVDTTNTLISAELPIATKAAIPTDAPTATTVPVATTMPVTTTAPAATATASPDVVAKPQKQQPNLVARTFYLHELREADQVISASTSPLISIIFDSAVYVSGNDGCNNYGGTYELTDWSNLLIGDLLATAMACAENEAMQLSSRYLGALQTATHLVVNDDTLTISYPTGQLIFNVNPPATTQNTPPDNISDKADGERSLVHVDSFIINLLESFPIQANLVVQGTFSNPCYAITLIEQDLVQQHTLHVSLEAENVSEEACVQVITPFEQIISLDILGLKAGEYTVIVNGVSGSLTLEMDNISDG